MGCICLGLDKLACLGMEILSISMYRKGEKKHPNKSALKWTLGTAITSFVGAGLLGLAHTLPQVNMYTHGTLVTAMHGHLAFWGAYAMIVLALISYSMPHLTGRKLFDSNRGVLAFWLSNIGMLGMTVAFGVAGVAEVYMERIMGVEFGEVQKEIEVHFFILVCCATMFTTGIVLYIIEFVKYGQPNDEALEIVKQ